jgi:catechol 2,3-dioxygenase-like lactoylglutathione lyase family enzyme
VPTLTQTIPALPVRDIEPAVAFYRDRLGFDVLHHEGGFAVLGRGDAVAKEGVATTDFGSRDFATLDADGNLISFFEWVEA